MSTGRLTRKMRDGEAMEFFTIPPVHMELTLGLDTQSAFISGAFDIDSRDAHERDGGVELPLRKMDWFKLWPSDSENETPVLVEIDRRGNKAYVFVYDPLCRRVIASNMEDTDDAP